MIEKRDVIIHFHIFKNAGTTIEWILEKNFSNNFVSKDTEDPQGILNHEDIKNILEKNKNIYAISSHQLRFPLPKNDRINFHPIIFIRHPIDRIFSIYSFQRRRKDGNRPGIKKAKELNLNDYIKWNFSVKKFMPMKNFQVMYLSKNDVSSKVNQYDLELSLQRIQNCATIGIVDQFDKSLVLAEEYLKNIFPEIDLAYKPQNVSDDRARSLDERINEGLEKLEEDVRVQIFEENKFDLLLYEKTKKDLSKRCSTIQDFIQKEDEFKQRCKKI